MNPSFAYLPPNERKKILLICDDLRVHSGVATVAREMVLNTVQHFNWIQIAGAINHPDKGKKLDLSNDTNAAVGLKDASVYLYPIDGYGDANFIRQLIRIEKPDAIFLITDPRYFMWLFQIENEIRRKIPIVYLNIWDDYPAPMYNRPFYEACDALLGISKQTVNINKLVLGEEKAKNKLIKYVPHGLNHDVFKPLTKDDPQYSDFINFKNQMFKSKEYDFVLFFNSRNIRRKQIPDTLLAYKYFIDGLPEEKAKKCAFMLHTAIVDDNGTDLKAVCDFLFDNNPKYNIIFSQQPLGPIQMNWLYNMSDAQILLTSNEGWGLSLTEAILVGNPIIANVTGGMQDQMRFVKNGKWVDFDADFPSNHNGTLKEHGEWAFPVYPTNRSIQGSPITPYIWDDRCTSEDAAKQIRAVYDLSKEERKAKGLKGREWALSEEAGLTGERMGARIISNLDELFATWSPREKFELINTKNIQKRVLNHKLLY
jgi:glycosyltransferase involved in cell wall biosynthesis